MMRLHNLAIVLFFIPFVHAQTVVIHMYMATKSVGTITAEDTKYGLLLTPNLSNLTPTLEPGAHGFHVHTNPSCADNGIAAGGHLDPAQTKHHLGPYNEKGELGDLPVIYVNVIGRSTIPVLAPRLTVKDILNHSLMIHSGGDNYSDSPANGGGGPRMICGVIPAKANS